MLTTVKIGDNVMDSTSMIYYVILSANCINVFKIQLTTLFKSDLSKAFDVYQTF